MVFAKTVGRREADDLPCRIDRIRLATRFSIHGAEVDDRTVFPERRVEERPTIRSTYDLTRFVDPLRTGIEPSGQFAEIHQSALLVPEERVIVFIRRVRIADDLPAIVHVAKAAATSAERAKVGHLAVFIEEGVRCEWK